MKGSSCILPRTARAADYNMDDSFNEKQGDGKQSNEKQSNKKQNDTNQSNEKQRNKKKVARN